MTRFLSAGCWLFVLLLLIGTSVPAAADEELRVGDPVSDFRFDGLVAPSDYAKLGLERVEGPVRLNDIKGDMLVLELYNRFCLSCWRQAPFMNSLWDQLKAEGLNEKVRVLGIATGNDIRDARQFKTEHKVNYPSAYDVRFDAMYHFSNSGGIPYSIFLVRQGDSWVVGDTHTGIQGDLEMMVRVKGLLSAGPQLRGVRQGTTSEKLPEFPPLSYAERDRIIRALFKSVSGKDLNFHLAKSVDEYQVYQAVGPDGVGIDLYARIASRRPACDLCHTCVFAFAFNKGGYLRGFIPIFVTKVGNVLWDNADVRDFRRTLRGRRMTAPIDLDIDAVTGATMTSSAIFDEVRRTAEVLDNL